MKKIIKILATIIFLNFYTLEIRAQIKKLGDISNLEFSSHNTKYDSTMPAIILFEYGYADFDSDVSAYLNYHKRMLILNDEGLEYANVEIPINKEFKQEVFEIKASSYRLSESGAISETKLNRKEIITEKFKIIFEKVFNPWGKFRYNIGIFLQKRWEIHLCYLIGVS